MPIETLDTHERNEARIRAALDVFVSNVIGRLAREIPARGITDPNAFGMCLDVLTAEVAAFQVHDA